MGSRYSFSIQYYLWCLSVFLRSLRGKNGGDSGDCTSTSPKRPSLFRKRPKTQYSSYIFLRAIFQKICTFLVTANAFWVKDKQYLQAMFSVFLFFIAFVHFHREKRKNPRSGLAKTKHPHQVVYKSCLWVLK